MPRAHYLFMMGMLIGGIPLIMLFAFCWLPRRIPRLANIPNRNFWLAPEHRDLMQRYLDGAGYFIAWKNPEVVAFYHGVDEGSFITHMSIAFAGAPTLYPFEVMRGRSWKNAFMLLDEAQNTTAAEIKMFLTRIGEDTTVVLNGDVNQCDLDQASGLRLVIHMIKSQMLPVPVVEFTEDDIVRSGVCAMWVRAFSEARL